MMSGKLAIWILEKNLDIWVGGNQFRASQNNFQIIKDLNLKIQIVKNIRRNISEY